MITTTSRNAGIEFFRFLFISVIVLWHFNNIVPLFQCGDFAVDFFFVLAGAMLFRSFLTHPDQDAIQFTFRRIRRIIIAWLLVLIPVFFIKNRDYLFAGGFRPETWFNYGLKLLHELLFLGQNGLYEGTSHYASWFICILIVGGGILYAALQFFKDKAVMLYFPVFSLLSLVYFYNTSTFEPWVTRGCWDMMFLRGCGEMAIGASIYYFAEKYQESLQKSRRLVDILSVVALAGLILLLFARRDYASYAPLFSSLILLGTLTDNSLYCHILRSPIWITLGGISFEMLLVHGLVKPIVSFAGIGNLPAVISVTLYFGLVVVCAFALKWLNKKMIPIIFPGR